MTRGRGLLNFFRVKEKDALHKKTEVTLTPTFVFFLRVCHSWCGFFAHTSTTSEIFVSCVLLEMASQQFSSVPCIFSVLPFEQCVICTQFGGLILGTDSETHLG